MRGILVLLAVRMGFVYEREALSHSCFRGTMEGNGGGLMRILTLEEAKTLPAPAQSRLIQSTSAQTTHWTKCDIGSFSHCDQIHPLQRKKVEKMLDCLRKDSNVVRVTVFGSSATERCHIGSDVDLYIELVIGYRVELRKIDDAIDGVGEFLRTVQEHELEREAENLDLGEAER